MYYFCRPQSLFPARRQHHHQYLFFGGGGGTTRTRKQTRSNYQGFLDFTFGGGGSLVLFSRSWEHARWSWGKERTIGYGMGYTGDFSKWIFHPVHFPSSGSTEGIGRGRWLLWAFLLFLSVFFANSTSYVEGGYDGTHFLFAFSLPPPLFFSLLNSWASFSVHIFTTTFCFPLLLDRIHRERGRHHLIMIPGAPMEDLPSKHVQVKSNHFST